ncbi:MAG: hypothetical protein E6I69_05705 [Chloroflexi bacterium]|nr:MAG: hypothetical protein E6I69_05705 [Chloroflexota bacterium]
MGSWDLPIGLLILCLVALAFGALAADSRPGFSDGRSGTVDADLPQGEHVKGSWTCGKYESLSG